MGLRRSLALASIAGLLPGVSVACSSCGCTLNSDWSSQGYAVGAGVRWDLRYDYFNQSELRSGTGSVDRDALEVPNEREIQQYTINRNLSLGFDYAWSRAWNISVLLPYFDRQHATLAEGDTELSFSHTRGIGDIRVEASYQGFSPDASTGVLFGLKLPSGSFNEKFSSGPQAGETIDRGLQSGTGTTDLLLGVYQFGNIGMDVGYFAQALLQLPVAERENFKPGAGINLNAGLRYLAWGAFTPQLQFNLRAEKRESGSEADVENSGATLFYFSPGFSWRFNKHWDGFGFMQVPVYERVNGFQLEPRVLFSAGLQYRM